MAPRSTSNSIDGYIAAFPPETQEMLAQVRAIIRELVPDATEGISYAMPTFDLNGKHLVHFAGFQRHIGFYPVSSGVQVFAEELKPYKHGKGSVQFPLDQPLPADLIRRIVTFRVDENRRKAARWGSLAHGNTGIGQVNCPRGAARPRRSHGGSLCPAGSA